MSTNQRWYRTGTITIADNASTATGTLTTWLNQVAPGDHLIIGNTIAEVASVQSNTGLTLGAPWTGGAVTAAAYAISRVSPLWSLAATLDLDVRRLLDGLSTNLRGSGPPAESFGADGSFYIDDTAKALYGPKTNGAWGAGVSMVGSPGAPGTPGASAAAPNLLINGDFQINQRVFAGGALAAGVFGHDRWKADTGGANVAVSGYAVTLTSGAICQVVENSVWGVASLASTACTISVDTPSADLTITLGSISGTITAGSGRRSVTLTPAAGDTGNLQLRIARATAGSVQFSRIKLEIGSSATPWQARPFADEIILARRYYQKSYPLASAPGAALYAGATTVLFASTQLTAPFNWGSEMRAAPTVAIFSPETGAANSVRDLTAGANRTGLTATGPASAGLAYIYNAASNFVPGNVGIVHWTAQAEL